MIVLFALLASEGKAQTFTELYEFQGGADGESPNDLVRDADGNFYGTTIAGGKTIFGTVFKLTASDKKKFFTTFWGWCSK